MGAAWARHEHGMASVNQTWPHCVNQMGKTHAKPLAARHGRGIAWAWHGHGMLCVNRRLEHGALYATLAWSQRCIFRARVIVQGLVFSENLYSMWRKNIVWAAPILLLRPSTTILSYFNPP